MMRVMLVDDEPWVLEGLTTMIDWGKYGFEVCGEALSGPDALRLIQELKPDLVLTDIHMPVINGLELITRINELMASPPKFVILSGYDDFKYARIALRQKVNEYLLKPIDDEEIEALLGRLSTVIQDEIALQKMVNRRQSLVVNSLINRFIQGEFDENLEHQAQRLMNLQGEAELLCIVMGANPLDQQLEDYFPRGLACCFQDGTGKTGILVQSASVTQDSLELMVTELRRAIMECSREPALLAISERRIGVQGIRGIYLQSLEVWKQKCNQQKSGIFYYSEIPKTKKNDDLHEEKFKQLLDKVIAHDTERIDSCVKEVFASFADNLLTNEVVQIDVAHLELTLCRLIAEINGEPNRIMNTLQVEVGNLGDQNDYIRLSRYVSRLCTLAAGYLFELKQQNEGNTIFNVIQYVDREFRTKLQLQDLARQFHMNSTYLGQLFRKHAGQSFSEYLNEKRIEEAKSLLKRTQLKISDIAVQVGYPNTDYFIDKFKKIVGVVPSVYKNTSQTKQL
ncbi:response regulator [Paenibacillus wynnii]|uniref:Chemotaxis protein CheY n=1 Tax=Paenibacillus wynnii TaxID=268407 RepID=A0A098MAN6_9BACL|nr:response regulator [Paenibacillus wynnii]KGE19108.1 hypothetical protein PWYN_06925 [Paenibacillus wynnii]